MCNRFPPVPRFVTPLPDENCYSVLCRCTVHAAVSTAKLCREMFGRPRNLCNYLWQPFRPEELDLWFDDAGERISSYLQQHSCMPYRYPFVEKRCQEYLHTWNEGTPLSNGHYKRVTRVLGYKFWRKDHLYYCPECVKEDRREYGETYWHMIPQLPGVVVCPVHVVPLEESQILIGNTKYHLMPAEYWLPKQEARREKVSSEDLRIATDSKWMMENGWHLDGRGFGNMLEEETSPGQRDKAKSMLSHYTGQMKMESDTLYVILIAAEKGVSLAEVSQHSL